MIPQNHVKNKCVNLFLYTTAKAKWGKWGEGKPPLILICNTRMDLSPQLRAPATLPGSSSVVHSWSVRNGKFGVNKESNPGTAVRRLSP